MPLTPGFQALHCLSFSGEREAVNTFVDGAAAVERTDEEATEILVKKIWFFEFFFEI